MRGRKPVPHALAVRRGNPGKRALPEATPQPEVQALPVPAEFDQLGAIAERAKQIWTETMPHMVRWGLISSMDEQVFRVFVIACARKEHADAAIGDSGLLLKTEGGYVYQNPYLSISNKCGEVIRAFANEFGLSPAARTRLAGTAQHELPFDDPLNDYEHGH